MNIDQLKDAVVAYGDARENARCSADRLGDVEQALDELAELLRRTLPLLTTLGDHTGNGPIDPARPGSLGIRCDVIADIRRVLLLRDDI